MTIPSLRGPLREILRVNTTSYLKMATQQAITGFTVPKNLPDTPKRKRAAKKREDLAETVSPSQVSPDHKAVRTAPDKRDYSRPMDTSTPRTDSPLQDVQEDIKRKFRGRGPEVNQALRTSTPPKVQRTAAETPLPHSPIEQKNPWEREEVSSGKKPDSKEESRKTSSPKEKVVGPVSTAPAEEAPGTQTKVLMRKKGLQVNTKASALKKATFANSLLKQLTPILPQWKARRVVVTFAIKLPKSKAKRTEYLARELNKFLVAAKKVSPNNRMVYVRRFKDHETIADTEKNYWIDSFGATQMSHLMDYTNGFYANQVLRDGTFRLTLQLVVPSTTEIRSFLDNLNGLWSDSTNKMVRDCNEQSLYSPKTIGWLLRSNWNMTSSDELQLALDKIGQSRYPGLVFGVTFKTIPTPGAKPQKYDKDTAIRAVVISTNTDYQIQAWETLFKIYNSNGTKYPLNIATHFVPTKDHPDIRNNPIAVQNITLLMDRQRMFIKNTFTLQCHALADPDREVPSGGTLRDKLSELTSRTMGEKVKGAKLFHAITQRSRDGTISYFITYHKAVEKEATSIISGIGAFMKAELKLDPDLFCFPIHVNPDHSWDPLTRTTTNSTVNFLTSLVADTIDIHAEEDSEEVAITDQEFEMGSKAEREFKRIAGLDDAETVANIAERKPAKPKPVPRQIASDDRSTKSEMSGLTNYSSESKMSQHRKELRRSVDEKELQLAEQDKQLKEMRKQMEEMRRASQGRAAYDDSMPTKTDSSKDTVRDKTHLAPKKDSLQHTQDEAHSNKDEDMPAHKWRDDQQLPDGSKCDVKGRPIFETDHDGKEWEIGWDIPLDNIKGDKREPNPDWFQVTSGPEIPTRAYARHMQSEGHEVVLSRTGSMKEGDLVVYVVVLSDDEEEQGSGEETGPVKMELAEDVPKVKFATNTEVQQYDPETMSLDNDNQVQQTKGKVEEEEFSNSSASSNSSQSSPSQAPSQSASESSSSTSSSKGDKVQVSRMKTVPVPSGEHPPRAKTPLRKPNLTKSTVEDTRKMIKQGLTIATTKVKLRSSAGVGPGQDS